MSNEEYQQEKLERVTAPQQSYSMSQVGTGFVVLAVGLLVTFVVPLLLG